MRHTKRLLLILFFLISNTLFAFTDENQNEKNLDILFSKAFVIEPNINQLEIAKILESAKPSDSTFQVQVKRRYLKSLIQVSLLSKQKWVHEIIQKLLLKLEKDSSFTNCSLNVPSAVKNQNAIRICHLSPAFRAELAQVYGQEIAQPKSVLSIEKSTSKIIQYQVQAAYFFSEGILALDFSQSIYSNFLSFMHESVHAVDDDFAAAFTTYVELLPQAVSILDRFLPELAQSLRTEASIPVIGFEKILKETPAHVKPHLEKQVGVNSLNKEQLAVLRRFMAAHFEIHAGKEIKAHYLEYLLFLEFSSPKIFANILPKGSHFQSTIDLLNTKGSLKQQMRALFALYDQDDPLKNLQTSPELAVLIAVREDAIMESRAVITENIREHSEWMIKSLELGSKIQSDIIQPIENLFSQIALSTRANFTAEVNQKVQLLSNYLSSKGVSFELIQAGQFTLSEVPLDDLSIRSPDVLRKIYLSLFDKSIPEWDLMRGLPTRLQALSLRVALLQKNTNASVFKTLETNANLSIDALKKEIQATEIMVSTLSRQLFAILQISKNAPDFSTENRRQLEHLMTYLTQFLKNLGYEPDSIQIQVEQQILNIKQEIERVRLSPLKTTKKYKIRLDGSNWIMVYNIDTNGTILSSLGTREALQSIHVTTRNYSVINYSIQGMQDTLVFANSAGTLPKYVSHVFTDAYGVGIVFSNKTKIYLVTNILNGQDQTRSFSTRGGFNVSLTVNHSVLSKMGAPSALQEITPNAANYNWLPSVLYELP